MAIAEINPDVPSSAEVPNTYLFISTAPTTTATAQPKDLFLVAMGVLSGSQMTNAPYSLTAGTAAVNEIRQYSSLSRVHQAFNRRSPIAGRFRSALQEVPIGINIFLAALKEPSNTGFAGIATKTLTFAGTAAGSGEIGLYLAGHPTVGPLPIPVADGDVASDIATAAKTAVDGSLMVNCPLVSAALIDLQFPIITITNNATGSNFVITANGISKTIAITAAWNPTLSATGIAAAIAADTAFPLTATSLAGVVTLTWRTGSPVSSLTIAGADATQVYALTYTGASGSKGVTMPLTYVVRGEDGNNASVGVRIPPEITGVTVSPGIITVATTALGASGSASLMTFYADTTPYVTSIPVGTTASDAATLIATTINGETGPLTASAAGPIVTLFLRSDWFVKRLRISSTEDALGQTYRLADRHDSAGVITSAVTTAGSTAYTSLQGAGVSSVATLLDNRAKFGRAFSEWSVDDTDTTVTSAIYAHVETYGNGYYNEGQRVTYTSTQSLEDAAAIAPAASPDLGNSWRYAVGVYQAAPCMPGAYAAQVAARLCVTDLPFNMDGRALALPTVEPLLPGRPETDLSPPEQEVALSEYKLFPYKGDRGNVRVIRGKTTWTADNKEWGDWSYGRIFDAVRFGMRAFLNNRFSGRVLFTGGGTIRVPNGFEPLDVKNAIGEYLDTIDGVLVDGASRLKKYIEVEPVSGNPGFLRVYFRIAPPRELHIISGVISSALAG